MASVKIDIQKVGQSFGVVAKVMAKNNRTIYESKLFPYGQESKAYHDAKHWAAENGHSIRDEG